MAFTLRSLLPEALRLYHFMLAGHKAAAGDAGQKRHRFSTLEQQLNCCPGLTILQSLTDYRGRRRTIVGRLFSNPR